MGYAKERGKFEILATKVGGLTIYDDKSVKIITDIFEQFSHSVRILKNKNPETFTNLFLNELEQVKVVKRALKLSEEADRQDTFVKYRDILKDGLESAVALTKLSD
ncbi:hypothetical protein EZJ43_10400 [Pedobacter changchengzhani]|uniref:Uncharacterized protein n=2 Tax=Pedobacter changchengzhani TaxID=2529274 RepID=A0A4V3A035_9SPHI|nr:hypothetical protein EZJ43_10400 [Pedobacter changchengzhani]